MQWLALAQVMNFRPPLYWSAARHIDPSFSSSTSPAIFRPPFVDPPLGVLIHLLVFTTSQCLFRYKKTACTDKDFCRPGWFYCACQKGFASYRNPLTQVRTRWTLAKVTMWKIQTAGDDVHGRWRVLRRAGHLPSIGHLPEHARRVRFMLLTLFTLWPLLPCIPFMSPEFSPILALF